MQTRDSVPPTKSTLFALVCLKSKLVQELIRQLLRGLREVG